MKNETPSQLVIEDLVDEVVALFHLLQAVAARVHQDAGITAAKRGVLKSIEREGAQTVPQMARARPVSRQYIQAIVNQLSAEGLVEVSPNPAHNRSGLIRLTPAGREMVAGLREREKDLIYALQLEAGDQDLQIALSVLRMIKERFIRLNWDISRPISVGKGE